MARQFDFASEERLEDTSWSAVTGPPVTLACWFNCDTLPSDLGDFPYLVSLTDFNSISQLAIVIDNSDDKVYAGGGAWAISTAAIASTGVWYHACGVLAATDDRAAFLDGGNKGTNFGAQAISGIDTAGISGRANGSAWDHWMDGRIAEAGIWNVALTDAEVAILAKGFSPLFVRPQSLVAYWPLIRDEDQDRVGGYDMTPQNTPTIAAHAPVIYPASVFVPGKLPVAAARTPRHPAQYNTLAIY